MLRTEMTHSEKETETDRPPVGNDGAVVEVAKNDEENGRKLRTRKCGEGTHVIGVEVSDWPELAGWDLDPTPA